MREIFFLLLLFFFFLMKMHNFCVPTISACNRIYDLKKDSDYVLHWLFRENFVQIKTVRKVLFN